jgi:hypothetical protein
MKKILVLACLLVVLAFPLRAQTGPQPLCGIGHTDATTGEFVCDDPTTTATATATVTTDGIGHTDGTEQLLSDAAVSLMTLAVNGVSALL